MTMETAGFIGLGVMGAPMCGHLARKAASAGLTRVLAHDADPQAVERLGDAPVQVAESVSALCAQSDVVLFCLPGGPQVSALTDGEDGLVAHARKGQIFVDLGTTPVPLTREIHERFAARGARFADAPITRTRQAAIDGTLSTLVGGDAVVLSAIEPLLRCFSTDVTHCGPIGAGQVVKQMNNMVLFETVSALAEAMTTARAAGVDPNLLFDAMSKGSADSFALRNHGRKAMLTGEFPERAFSVRYALKDLDYARELAESLGLRLAGADQVRERFMEAIERGDGDAYFPVIARNPKPR